MSFPPNKSDGPKEGKLKPKSGKIKDDYSHKWADPMTTEGQPSCRSEQRKEKGGKY